MFVGKISLPIPYDSTDIRNGLHVTSTESASGGRVEGSAFKADFSTSAHPRWADGRNDYLFLRRPNVIHTYNLDVHPRVGWPHEESTYKLQMHTLVAHLDQGS